jgi:hypothetical protein
MEKSFQMLIFWQYQADIDKKRLPNGSPLLINQPNKKQPNPNSP